MTIKQVTRIRGTTLKLAAKTSLIREFLKISNSAMMSVNNFDATQDSASDYRRCLAPVYNQVADMLNSLAVGDRPAILRNLKKVKPAELCVLSVHMHIAAGYLKIEFNVVRDNTAQSVVLSLRPEGRQPAIPALLAAGKMDPENPILF